MSSKFSKVGSRPQINVNINENETYLTPKEAAAYLKMGVSTLAKLKMKKIGPVWIAQRPNSVRYARADLDAFMQSRRVAQAGE